MADSQPTRRIARLRREADPRRDVLPGLAELFVVAPGRPNPALDPVA